MAGAGRPRKPAEIHQLNANPGGRPLPNAPKSDKPIGSPPPHFTAAQKKDWRAVVKNAPRGVLTYMDRGPLIAWVVAHDTHREAMQKVAENGLVETGSQGSPIVSPYIRIQDSQAAIMLRASSELGFTPSSRSKVGAINQQPRAGKFSNNGVRS